MIPLKTNVIRRRIPIITLALIAMNVFIFLHELRIGYDVESLFMYFGLVPRRYTSLSFYQHFGLFDQLVPFVSSTFLHGGWLHIIGNMWFLWIFGGDIEERIGLVRYLAFYLVCGFAAGLIQVISVIAGCFVGIFHVTVLDIPTIGASGAVAGVMGAFLVLYPRSRVLTLVPIFIFLQVMALPAYIVLGLWFIIQFFNGSFALLSGGQGFAGVAWWAHVGGFLAGMLLVRAFQKHPPRIRR